MIPLSINSITSGAAAQLTDLRDKFGPGGKIPAADLEQLTRSIGSDQNPAISRVGGGGDSQFSSVLGDLVNGTSQKQATAVDAVNGLYAGQAVPLHQAMIANEEASISFQLMVEVRNKLLESYQELMRMQV